MYFLLYPPSGNWSFSICWSDAFLGGFVDNGDGDIGHDGDGIEEEIDDGDDAVAGDTGDIAGGTGGPPDFISTAVQLTLEAEWKKWHSNQDGRLIINHTKI